MQFNEHAVEHFLTLAKRGGQPACSGGERRAYRLLNTIKEEAGGLDETAIEGAGDFMKLVAANYTLAMELLKGGA